PNDEQVRTMLLPVADLGQIVLQLPDHPAMSTAHTQYLEPDRDSRLAGQAVNEVRQDGLVGDVLSKENDPPRHRGLLAGFESRQAPLPRRSPRRVRCADPARNSICRE